MAAKYFECVTCLSEYFRESCRKKVRTIKDGIPKCLPRAESEVGENKMINKQKILALCSQPHQNLRDIIKDLQESMDFLLKKFDTLTTEFKEVIIELNDVKVQNMELRTVLTTEAIKKQVDLLKQLRKPLKGIYNCRKKWKTIKSCQNPLKIMLEFVVNVRKCTKLSSRKVPLILL